MSESSPHRSRRVVVRAITPSEPAVVRGIRARHSMLAYPIASRHTLEANARSRPNRLTTRDWQLLRLTEEQYAAAILGERAKWASDFASRGDPSDWPEWSALSRRDCATALCEWAHWHGSPDTYFTRVDPPLDRPFCRLERP